MASVRCTIEVHDGVAWRPAAEVRGDEPAIGIRGATRLDYDLD